MQILFVVLLKACCSYSFASDGPATQTAYLPANFAAVSDGIYRGGAIQSSAVAANLYKKIGIKTVINLQGGDYNDAADVQQIGADLFHAISKITDPGDSPEGIAAERQLWQSVGGDVHNYFNFPLDAVAAISPSEAQEIESVLKLLMDPQTPRPIYVHCTHGVDRTGLVIALYRVLHDQWAPQKAHDEMVCRGHDPDIQGSNHFMDFYFYKRVDPQALTDGTYLGTDLPFVSATFGHYDVVAYNSTGQTPTVLSGPPVSDKDFATTLVQKYGVKTVINLEGAHFNDPAEIKLFSAALWHQYQDKLDPASDPKAIELEKSTLDSLGIAAENYHQIPLSSANGIPSAKLDEILKLLADPTTPGPIYIHESSDEFWVSFVRALYRIKVQGQSGETAFKELLTTGFDPYDYDNFANYLVKFANDGFVLPANPYDQQLYCESLAKE